MKKRMVIVICIFAVMLFLGGLGVTAKMLMKWSDTDIFNYWRDNGSLMNSFEDYNNLSLEEMTAYDYDRFMFVLGSRFIRTNASSEIYSLGQFNKSFPIERVEKIDSEHILVVYKLKRENAEEVFTYVVFEKEVNYFKKEDGVDADGEYELWKKNGEFYFFTDNTLSSMDFAHINVGDSAATVAEIDPAVLFEYNECGYVDPSAATAYYQSYRVLTDGIMVIEFEAKMLEGQIRWPDHAEFYVASVLFYPFDGDDFPAKVSIREPAFCP